MTGGAGFIGSNFINYWHEAHPDDLLVCFDALTYAGNLSSIQVSGEQENYVFVHGDICEEDAVVSAMRSYQIDTIVHFAAESHVDRSISGPDAFLDTNLIGTHSLLKAARALWLGKNSELPHRFHHISTDEVYGTLERHDPGFSEATAYAPNSPYSASKAASDFMVRAYHHTYGLEVTTSNCSNNYGPYHFPEKLIPLTITNVLRNLPLPIYGDGKQVRDWLFVRDHVKGIEAILDRGISGQTYNIGGNNEWENLAIVKLICQKINDAFASDSALAARFPEASSAIAGNCEELISHVEDRPGHDRRYAIDASKIQRELAFYPVETFDSGIEQTIRWYLRNEYWWKPLIS